MEPKISGPYRQVVTNVRWSFAQVWLFLKWLLSRSLIQIQSISVRIIVYYATNLILKYFFCLKILVLLVIAELVLENLKFQMRQKTNVEKYKNW